NRQPPLPSNTRRDHRYPCRSEPAAPTHPRAAAAREIVRERLAARWKDVGSCVLCVPVPTLRPLTPSSARRLDLRRALAARLRRSSVYDDERDAAQNRAGGKEQTPRERHIRAFGDLFHQSFSG